MIWQKKDTAMKKSGDLLFNSVIGFIFVILCFITVYPFIYALSFSLSDGILALQKDLILWPVGWNLDNYRLIFKDNRVVTAAFISVSRTVLGALLFVAVTGLSAYSMSKKRLKGRKSIFIFFVIPMYIGGGLLPFYMLIHDLHLMNNFLVYIIPGCFSTFFMILMKVYMETIPEALEESAFLDGAGDTQIAFKIYLPLCIPVIVTVALFAGVGQWNSWFDSLLYVTNKKLRPLQMLLQNLMQENEAMSGAQLLEMGRNNKKRLRISSQSYQMAVLIVTTLPIVFIYPFAQKYFVKGMIIGAVKL